VKRRRKPGYLFFDDLTRGPFEFLWEVPVNGFVWREERVTPIYETEPDRIGNPPPFLVLTRRFDQARRYPPLKSHNLHRSCMALWARSQNREIDLGDIRSFANKWGCLGHGIALNGIASSTVLGESCGQWRREIIELATLVDVWDLVKHQRDDKLRSFITWNRHPDGAQRFDIRYKPYTISGARIGFGYSAWDDEKEDRFGSVLEPFRDYLFQRINDRLRGHVSPVIYPFEEGSNIYMRPDCLVSAMYVLFTLEISHFMREKSASKVCRGCDEYFSPSHGRQVYHHQSCRWRANKRRSRLRRARS
jgi:hypothetical protein